MDARIAAAVIAGAVSIVVGVISFLSARYALREEVRKSRHQVRQAQLKDVLAKRIEFYPQLWQIHIKYETNWVLEGRPKTHEWAQEYATALNDFNLRGGLFLSEDLYSKFGELRSHLHRVLAATEAESLVDEEACAEIRHTVYGGDGRPGLATHLKDDLGSYRYTGTQRRSADE